MTRLEELDILIEAQNKKVEEAWAPLSALLKDINKEFNAKVDLALQVIDPTAKSCFHMSDLLEASGSVEQLDEKGGRIFAGGFDMYFSTHYSDDRSYHLSFNVGTCGSFTKEDKVQYNRYMLLGTALEHAAEWEAWLISAVEKVKPLKEVFWQEENTRDKLECEKESIEDDQKKAAILATIKIGNVYKNKNYTWYKKSKDFKGYSTCKLVEFTNKLAKLAVGSTDTDGNFMEYDTYQMKKEDFENAIYWGRYVRVEKVEKNAE